MALSARRTRLASTLAPESACPVAATAALPPASARLISHAPSLVPRAFPPSSAATARSPAAKPATIRISIQATAAIAVRSKRVGRACRAVCACQRNAAMASKLASNNVTTAMALSPMAAAPSASSNCLGLPKGTAGNAPRWVSRACARTAAMQFRRDLSNATTATTTLAIAAGLSAAVNPCVRRPVEPAPHPAAMGSSCRSTSWQDRSAMMATS